MPWLVLLLIAAMVIGVCVANPGAEGHEHEPCGPWHAICMAALAEFGLDEPAWALTAFDATLWCESKYLNVGGDYDRRDRGIWQINRAWHPEISDAQAFDPVFATRWAAWMWAQGRAWEWDCWRHERWGPSWRLVREVPRVFPLDPPARRAQIRLRAVIVNTRWLGWLMPLGSAPSRPVPWWEWIGY